MIVDLTHPQAFARVQKHLRQGTPIREAVRRVGAWVQAESRKASREAPPDAPERSGTRLPK